MSIKVFSWHCNHDFFRKASCAGEGVVPPLGFGQTHFKLPVVLEVPDAIEDTDALAKAFDYFNWTHFDFVAPDEVNALARKKETHASQSVGDIVEIEGRGWWMVKGVGWQKLTMFDTMGRM